MDLLKEEQRQRVLEEGEQREAQAAELQRLRMLELQATKESLTARINDRVRPVPQVAQSSVHLFAPLQHCRATFLCRFSSSLLA
jgi:hypothetical protein